MSKDKEETNKAEESTVKADDQKDDAVANSEAEGKTFDMYHVKSRVDLLFLVLFVLAMVAVFVYALYIAIGSGV